MIRSGDCGEKKAAITELTNLSDMENTLSYLIVEDDEFDRCSAESEAEKFPFLKKIASCSHPLQAAELIAQHRHERRGRWARGAS